MASLPKRPTKKHVKYTSFETDAIIKGIEILGDNPGRWADIKRMFPLELAQRTPLQIRDRWFVVKKKLELNDPQGSTSQVLNMTATQQAPTALVPHLQPTQVQVQPIARVRVRVRVRRECPDGMLGHVRYSSKFLVPIRLWGV